VGFWRS